MTITEDEQLAIDDKLQCFKALKGVAESAVAEGLAEHFDDALVDFVVSLRLSTNGWVPTQRLDASGRSPPNNDDGWLARPHGRVSAMSRQNS